MSQICLLKLFAKIKILAKISEFTVYYIPYNRSLPLFPLEDDKAHVQGDNSSQATENLELPHQRLVVVAGGILDQLA